MRSDDEEKLMAAKKEFDLVIPLKHPNIVQMIEYIYDDFKNTIYIIMEFIPGQELTEFIMNSHNEGFEGIHKG